MTSEVEKPKREFVSQGTNLMKEDVPQNKPQGLCRNIGSGSRKTLRKNRTSKGEGRKPRGAGRKP
jgi:hypothetical protein